MSWIKRNLYFLILSVMAMALLGAAGWFFYGKWQLNADIMNQLNEQYSKLDTLNKQEPHPGAGAVDNGETVKQEQKRVVEVMRKLGGTFQHIAAIPPLAEGTNSSSARISPSDFSGALRRTIDQLQRAASAASVTLPADYCFSFQTHKQRMTFAPGSLEPLAIQLGEVKVLCDVLFQAGISGLDSIRRERVSSDDMIAAGGMPDYIEEQSSTNDLAVMTPYTIVFRSFSSELANVLNGFANSPYALVVRTIDVETIASSGSEADMAAAAAAAATAGGADLPAANNAGRSRRTGGYQSAPVVAPVTPTATKGGLPVILDEKQLKITLAITIVKPLHFK